MVVKFYNYTGERTKINKVLSDPKEINGRVSFWNVRNPVIRVRANVDGFTYCFVASLNRYYFIDTVQYDGDIAEISLTCDVLTTFAGQITHATGTVYSTDKPNRFDGDFKPVCDSRIGKQKILFPVDALKENGSIVMITIKGNK